MPRYSDVDTITFTDINGRQYPVKDIRPISTQTLAFEIDKNENNLLDEIASRREVYGDFGEIQSWRIFDLNVEKIANVGFDFTKIKKVKIPI